jgi:hypothetical protein
VLVSLTALDLSAGLMATADIREDAKNEILALSMAVRFKYDMKPPLTTKVSLMTLFQAKFTYALSLVAIDKDASLVECYVATRLLCYKFSIPDIQFQDCLKTAGSECCSKFSGVYVIARITTRHKVKVWQEAPKHKKVSDSIHNYKSTVYKKQEVDISSIL